MFGNNFASFFRNFRDGNVYIYRDALIRQWRRREFFVEVDLAHVNEYDEVLFNNLQSRPDDIMPFFEAAAKDALKKFLMEASTMERDDEKVMEFQVILKSSQLAHPLRNLNADLVNQLVKVPGIIISSTKSRAKATTIHLICNKCHEVKKIASKGPMQSVQIPGKCDSDKNMDGSLGMGRMLL